MNLIHQNHSRYLTDRAFLRLLEKYDMCIPSDFILNAEAIDAFWKTYYPNGAPRIVICGSNHGRYGAGQTGIPYIDFCSLQQLIPDMQRQDHEKSAHFFFRVIQAFGVNEFFLNFYVTHVSSVGFSNGDARALNSYELPAEMLQKVESNFLEEMEIVQPTHVVSLGKRVHETVRRLLPASVDCSSYLPDPNWVATFKSQALDDWVIKYTETLRRKELSAAEMRTTRHPSRRV